MIMSKNRYRSSRGAIVLNAIALAVTILPIISIGWWTFDMVKPDSRQTVSLQQIEARPAPRLHEEPLVTVTFDDGWESIYSEAAPIMGQYQIASTQYILPSQFNAPQYMSVGQALSMRQAGHEITSHTYTHANLTKLSDKQIKEELDTSIEVLKKFDLIDEDNLNFAAPLGATDSRVMSHVESRFASTRNVMGDLGKDISGNDMTLPGKLDRYNITGYTVGQYTTDEQFQGALNYAKKHNAWFIPIYHQIDDSGDKYSVTPETFERHMKMIKASGIKTGTMREVLRSEESQ
jgi:peptidoglycan/xylan/chitin deacetylase (PgdA/CDA1 family)